MASLFIAALTFVMIHVGISGSAARPALVRALGQRGYLLGYSVLSVAAMAWLVSAYNGAAYLPTWGMLTWWKPVQLVLMLPATLLVVGGLATPNPTAMGQEQMVAREPAGLLRITRHPFLSGVAIWAAVHLIGNGDVASALFFGSLLAVAVLGPASIDAKRARTLPLAQWDRFVSRTSIVPFAAILAGRNRLVVGEIGVWRLAAGVAVFVALVASHDTLFGVNPLGF